MLPQSHASVCGVGESRLSRIVVGVIDLFRGLVGRGHAVDGLVGQLRANVLGVAKVGD